MIFAAELEHIINWSIQAEYNNTCKQFGYKYLCVEDMYKATENAISELAQIGAVLMKIRNTIVEVKNEN